MQLMYLRTSPSWQPCSIDFEALRVAVVHLSPRHSIAPNQQEMNAWVPLLHIFERLSVRAENCVRDIS